MVNSDDWAPLKGGRLRSATDRLVFVVDTVAVYRLGILRSTGGIVPSACLIAGHVAGAGVGRVVVDGRRVEDAGAARLIGVDGGMVDVDGAGGWL
jgi:hypothetical protein